MYLGSMVALVTPMNRDGSIEYKSLQNLIEWHIASKTAGIIVAGTTGESATLTAREQSDLIATVVKQVNKRIPVIAGTGSNSTQHTLDLTLNAKKAGADACLIVTPYYNKPTQNGLYAHYKFVAENSSLPIILYNVPGRTGCDMQADTVGKLSQIFNIIGIKEATGKVERAKEILNCCERDFVIYSGDDATALDLMVAGAKGVISVTANVAPAKMYDLCQAALAGNNHLAEKLNADLMPLHTKLFLEANPIPVKWVLNQMGFIPPGIRMPLLPLDAKFHSELKEIMHLTNLSESIEK